MMKQSVDYIIVGGGIGGVCLALQLTEQNKSFVLFHDDASSASLVAAGLINPIVVKRIVKSWKADELIPYAESFYTRWSETLGSSFYTKFPMYRIFPGMHEQNQWIQKLESEEFRHFLSDRIEFYKEDLIQLNEAGGADILQCSKIDAQGFFRSCFAFLESKNNLIKQRFNHELVIHREHGVQYENYSAGHLIFADGLSASKNPYFNFLNFYPCKGEVLEIKAENLQLDKGVKKKVFMVPKNEDIVEVGSNYNWHFEDDSPTDEGKKAITEGIDDILKTPYQIVSHRAGIRPASRDRRPFIGRHPEWKNIYCFNGLGTRGYLISPFFSNELINLCENRIDEIPECNPARYWKKTI